MKGNVMGIVFACEADSKLSELTLYRTTASLPVGGRYRMIDFALSNLVNSGITAIGLITRSNYSSLMDHIRMGKDWDLSRKNSGLVVFPPYVLNNRSMFQGNVEALYGIEKYFSKRHEEYVVICPANTICKINFEDVVTQHLKTNADITMVTYETDSLYANKNIVITKNGRVKDMLVTIVPNRETKSINMKAYVIKKDLLVSLVDDAYARGKMDFETNIIFNNLDKLNIMEYKQSGYVAVIDRTMTFFKANMDLLNYDIRKEIFDDGGKIYTKVMDSSPTVYLENCKIKNSLIADGCVIDGTVENSILFRGVKVEKGAVIKNSIVMQKSVIMTGSSLNYTITDKNVIVKNNRNFSGHNSYPIVIAKDKIV